MPQKREASSLHDEVQKGHIRLTWVTWNMIRFTIFLLVVWGYLTTLPSNNKPGEIPLAFGISRRRSAFQRWFSESISADVYRRFAPGGPGVGGSAFRWCFHLRGGKVGKSRFWLTLVGFVGGGWVDGGFCGCGNCDFRSWRHWQKWEREWLNELLGTWWQKWEWS